MILRAINLAAFVAVLVLPVIVLADAFVFPAMMSDSTSDALDWGIAACIAICALTFWLISRRGGSGRTEPATGDTQ